MSALLESHQMSAVIGPKFHRADPSCLRCDKEHSFHRCLIAVVSLRFFPRFSALQRDSPIVGKGG